MRALTLCAILSVASRFCLLICLLLLLLLPNNLTRSDGGNDLVKTQTPLMGLERRPEVHVVGAAEGVPTASCGVEK